MSKKKIILSIITLTILSVATYGFWFAYRNTEFFTKPNREEIIENNSSSPTNEETIDIDLTTLVPKNVIVPEKFKSGIFSEPKTLNLPENFEISVFEANLNAPRHMDFTNEGTLIVTDKKAGQILLLTDTNRDNISDESIIIVDNLRHVHGLDFYNGDLYFGEEDKISVLKDLKEDGSYSKREALIDNLPSGEGTTTIAGHVTRTVRVGPDLKLYFTIGSSCNLCEEKDQRRATMMVANLDGSNPEIFATGLRNTVDFTFIPNFDTEKEFDIVGVDNGRDRIGDDLPPEEINLIEQEKDYGWPYCYGNGVNNPEYEDRKEYCQNETEGALYNMQAHSAPLGIINVNNDNLPKELQDNYLITFHGSWNRTTPTGYKLVRIDRNNPDAEPINFVTGWLEENGDKWGRPVGVVTNQAGDIFITDDSQGVVYLVKYRKSQKESPSA